MRKPYLKNKLIWSFLLLNFLTMIMAKILDNIPILRIIKLAKLGLKLSLLVKVSIGIPKMEYQATEPIKLTRRYKYNTLCLLKYLRADLTSILPSFLVLISILINTINDINVNMTDNSKQIL